MTKFDRLKKYRQRPTQVIQVFAEIVLGKDGEIFTPDELKIWMVEKDIVQIFIKGLRDKTVAHRVLNKNPNTLIEAVKLANDARETAQRLQFHGLNGKSGTPRVEEDMDLTEINQLSAQTQQRPTKYSPS